MSAIITLGIGPVVTAGAADWTDAEKAQIRQALGVTGTTAATESTGDINAGFAGLASDAEVADAVWNEARSGHSTAGTFGAVDEWAGTGGATAQEVWEYTTRTLTQSSTGSGATAYSITVQDEDSNPIDGVEVWITTDSAGSNVVAGTLTTDAMGLVIFMLDAGDYYVWRQASGYNFTNPVAITVS